MSVQVFRQSRGGRIDREKPLTFRFNDVVYTGYEGDTLASALLANGVRLVGRSFKFHRPRGIFSAGVEEPNALVTVGSGGLEEASVRATVQPLYEGLVARSQHCWPGVNFDLGRLMDFLSGLFPAGFYNKTFKWPDWHWYEGFIRRAAGLANLPPATDPDVYVHKNVHCDLLIVGGGPAGIAAALAVAGTGARVMLAEQDTELGGSLLWQHADIGGLSSVEWLGQALAKLKNSANVTVVSRATVSAYFDHHYLVITERLREQGPVDSKQPRERLWKVRAGKIILATGAHEQPLLFPNNDRPGIMQASAIRHYLNRYSVQSGKRVAIATNNDSAYQTGLDLKAAGVNVACVVDTRTNPVSQLVRKIREQGIPVFLGAVVSDTRGTKGIHAVRFGTRDTDNAALSEMAMIRCDCLGVSGGWQPVVHLLSQARGKLRWDEMKGAFVPDVVPENVEVIGAANGTSDLAQALDEGSKAGSTVLSSMGFSGQSNRKAPVAKNTVRKCVQAERIPVPVKSQKQWIDYQHDVTLRDIDIAVSENFISIEHLKRYTSAGMSVDQGKTSNINALVALAARTHRSPGEVGTTTFRPFYTPVTMGSIAGQRHGRFYSSSLRTPMHDRHEQLHASFQDYGPWRRPGWYPQGSEDKQQAIAREVRAARQAVSMFDGSPLGKIEVRGKDAEIFLNRMYVNQVGTMQAGRSRYALMTNENGVIIDDGILCRLTEDHFLAHTSSAGATRIYAWMESWLQGEWPDLDVLLTPVSTQWANIALSGPKARELVARLDLDFDLSNAAFPHMGIRETGIGGVPVRILRASFTGENGYEINVPADFGRSLWDGILELGRDLGVTPIGLESLNVMRTEKGYLHVGGDTDGTSTPLDIGWKPAVERKNEFFVGKRSLYRPQQQRDDRLHFVGLAPVEAAQVIAPGAHVVAADFVRPPALTQGYVTSACYSPTLERHVALGLVQRGRERLGEEIRLYHNGATQKAAIVLPAFYDPNGDRLNA